MNDTDQLEELIAHLSAGLGHSRSSDPTDPAVVEACDSFLASLGTLGRNAAEDRIEVRIEGLQFVDAEDVLTAATISGRKLIEVVRSCSAGGLAFDRTLQKDEFLRFLCFAREKGGAPEALAESAVQLLKHGVQKVQLLEERESTGWRGGSAAPSEWSAVGVELGDAVPVYQSMFETVDESLRRAGTGSAVDVNAARTVSEELVRVSSEGFDNLFQLARYPDYDTFTVGHSVRVALFSLYVGTYLGARREVLTEIGAAGLMHDVGKGRVPHEILYKRGELDEDEWQIMSQHPDLGAQILIESEDASPYALGAAWGHHLRFDGRGYPDTAPWARSSPVTALIHVCDVFEALTACRPYKKALSPARAYAIMFADRGAFDPNALSAFVRALGLYPPGSFVRLSDQSLARVQSAGASVDRPVVRILGTQQHVDLAAPEAAHLAVCETIPKRQALVELKAGAARREEAARQGEGAPGPSAPDPDGDAGSHGCLRC